MAIFDFLRRPAKTSAAHAKERLQILLAHERADRAGADFLPMLQKDILAVIARYCEIEQDKVQVKLDRNGGVSLLEVNIELPGPGPAPRSAPMRPSQGLA